MKISLVLGSGGARGYAHIGVIEELEKAGFKIASISGSSMGALIGGLYGAGGLKAYKEWVLGLDVWDVVGLFDISFDKRGFIRGEKVFEKLHEIVGDVKIEDLDIAFTAVATDLKKGREVWFQEGDLLKAIRASVSIPSFFTPVEHEGMLLVDGGVLNPIPVAPTMSDHNDKIIAVNVYADVEKPDISLPVKEQEKKRRLEKTKRSFQKSLSALIEDDKEFSMFDIVDRSFDTMQHALTRYRLAAYPPDYLIEISKDICGTYDFHKAYEVIEAGRIAARDFIAKL